MDCVQAIDYNLDPEGEYQMSQEEEEKERMQHVLSSLK